MKVMGFFISQSVSYPDQKMLTLYLRPSFLLIASWGISRLFPMKEEEMPETQLDPIRDYTPGIPPWLKFS
jgi:hypothetical protein